MLPKEHNGRVLVIEDAINVTNELLFGGDNVVE